jgi:periplasmic protein TonB
MFDQLVVSGEKGDLARTHKPWSVGVSVMIQAAILGAIMLIPLIYTEALPKAMLSTFLVAPPPPAPPPPPQQAVVRQVQHVKTFAVNAMTAPTVIPKAIAEVKDEAPPSVAANDTPGVAGGTGDVLGGLGTGAVSTPPSPAPPKRITVGGAVQAASLIKQVTPAYPAIAKSANISGTVVLHAIIAKDGSIEQLAYISGPPMLMASALSAVKEWRYHPTLLNGEPVEVDTTVQVVFSLG